LTTTEPEEQSMTDTVDQADPQRAQAYRVGMLRRGLDLAAVAVLLVPALMVLGVAALLILLTDGRPVTFRQVRIGEGGRPFALSKLRTMRAAQSGPAVTAEADSRITPVGAFLRRTSIDELPQLWHVLRGQMTLVGPRPESEELARRYPLPCRSVLQARPGLTGPTQLYYREHSALAPGGWEVEAWYLTVLVPVRVAADREYLDRPTLGRTLRFLLLTALFVVGAADLQREVDPQTARRMAR
jgi:lipopolysaccharide/colanic/teichoic acid biosynthesis glycosyltransferase